MRFDHIVSLTIGQVVGRLIRRVLAMIVLALFFLGTIYHLTVAGTVALEGVYSPLYARLMIAGAYLVITIAIGSGLYLTRARPLIVKPRTSGSRASQDAKMAMLLESVLAGFTAPRRKSR